MYIHATARDLIAVSCSPTPLSPSSPDVSLFSTSSLIPASRRRPRRTSLSLSLALSYSPFSFALSCARERTVRVQSALSLSHRNAPPSTLPDRQFGGTPISHDDARTCIRAFSCSLPSTASTTFTAAPSSLG